MKLPQLQKTLKEFKHGTEPTVFVIHVDDWMPFYQKLPIKKAIKTFPVIKTPWGFAPSYLGVPFYISSRCPRGSIYALNIDPAWVKGRV